MARRKKSEPTEDTETEGKTSSEPTEDGETEEDVSPIISAFRRKATAGIFQFLFEDYPSWMVFGNAKAIAPFCRIIIGDDDDGTVLLDKNVLITGMLHLIDDLTRSVISNVHLATELKGFVFPVPGGPAKLKVRPRPSECRSPRPQF